MGEELNWLYWLPLALCLGLIGANLTWWRPIPLAARATSVLWGAAGLWWALAHLLHCDSRVRLVSLTVTVLAMLVSAFTHWRLGLLR
jgi:hypothetical protein